MDVRASQPDGASDQRSLSTLAGSDHNYSVGSPAAVDCSSNGSASNKRVAAAMAARLAELRRKRVRPEGSGAGASLPGSTATSPPSDRSSPVISKGKPNVINRTSKDNPTSLSTSDSPNGVFPATQGTTSTNKRVITLCGNNSGTSSSTTSLPQPVAGQLVNISQASAIIGSESSDPPFTAPNGPKVPPLKIVLGSNASTCSTTSACSSTQIVIKKEDKPSQPPTTTDSTSEASSTTGIQVSNPVNVPCTVTTTPASSVTSTTSSTSTSNINAPTLTGRVTRSSQRAAAAQSATGSGDDQQEASTGRGETRKRKNRNRGVNGANSASSQPVRARCSDTERTLEVGEEDNDSSSSSGSIASLLERRAFQMPAHNCLSLYRAIRKQVDNRRSLQPPGVQPTYPAACERFLVCKGGYLLQPRAAHVDVLGTSAVEPPAGLCKSNSMRDLFIKQELERRRLRLQHHIEKEKMRLSAEQEILRVHQRAALANLTLPLLSACTVLKDAEIYNTLEPPEANDVNVSTEQAHKHETPQLSTDEIDDRKQNNSEPAEEPVKEEQEKVEHESVEQENAQPANEETEFEDDPLSEAKDLEERPADAKQLNNCLHNVHEKWLLVKKDTLLRHRREAESLQAIQRLNWQWRGKEFNLLDTVDDRLVPLVLVGDDFDLLPSA